MKPPDRGLYVKYILLHAQDTRFHFSDGIKFGPQCAAWMARLIRTAASAPAATERTPAEKAARRGARGLAHAGTASAVCHPELLRPRSPRWVQ